MNRRSDPSSLGAVSSVRILLSSGEFRRLRVQAGVSLSELARSAGVAVSSLSRWETGGRVPGVEHALVLADAVAAIEPRRRGRHERHFEFVNDVRSVVTMPVSDEVRRAMAQHRGGES